MSADPALGEYIPLAPVNDEAKKHNQNLPGMGGIYNTVNFHLYHYAGNNPVKYTDPDGRTTHKKSVTRGILNILLGKENVDRIWDEPFYDGFAEISDTILFAAIEIPCVIIEQASDYVGIFALATGNVPLAVAAESVGKTTDAISFGTAVLKAYTTDDWSNVYKQAAAKGISSFISFKIDGKFADIRVFQSQKSGGYYQKGYRGRLSNKSGMRKAFIQKMAPEIGKKAAKEIFNSVWDAIQTQAKKQKNEE